MEAPVVNVGIMTEKAVSFVFHGEYVHTETGKFLTGEQRALFVNGNIVFNGKLFKGEFYQFNLSSCIRQQNSLTAQFVSFSLSNLANIFYPPNFYNN